MPELWRSCQRVVARSVDDEIDQLRARAGGLDAPW